MKTYAHVKTGSLVQKRFMPELGRPKARWSSWATELISYRVTYSIQNGVEVTPNEKRSETEEWWSRDAVIDVRQLM